MRIYGTNATGTAVNTPANRRTGSSGFTLPEESTRPAGAASSPGSVGGIDALIALQGVEDPLERRRHAVKRGRVALDALDELKIGLLGGELTPATLGRLQSAAAYLKQQASGDSRLDSVLAEIELRVEVEIAKMSAR